MKRDLRRVPVRVRRELLFYLCGTSWSQRRIKEVWRVLQQHRRRLQKLSTITERCLDDLPFIDPATRQVLESSADQLNRTIEQITCRLPVPHREWVRSGRLIFAPGAQGPSTASYWVETRKRTQAAFTACVDLLHENGGLELPHAIRFATQAIQIARLEGVGDVDPNYGGPYRRPDLKRSGVNLRFGEPKHFHESGRGGRRPAPRAKVQLVAAIERELLAGWPKLVVVPGRRPEIARQTASTIAGGISAIGRPLTSKQRVELRTRLAHSSSTPHSIAVRCVSWIEGCSIAAVRKAVATKRLA